MLFRRKKIPVFVLGCQRSGTTVCLEMFSKTRQFTVFGEGDARAMTTNYCIRPKADIDRLIDDAKTRYVILKPLNDSQLADRFLDDYPKGKVIWLYRNVYDTVNSAVMKWGAGQAKMMTTIGRALANTDSLDAAIESMQDWPSCAMYAHRMSEETCKKLISWTTAPIDENTGAAILWYIRNQIFFDCELHEHRRATLLQYDQYVTNPTSEVRRVCDFLGARFSKRMVSDVHGKSVGRRPPPEIAPGVLAACLELEGQLDKIELLQRSGSEA